MSAPMRILNKLGPYIFTVVVVGVVVFVATLFFTWSTGLNAPKTTAELPAYGAAASPAEDYTAPVSVEPEGSYFGGEDSIVASVEVMDDDIIITLKTSSEANATQTHAPYVLQEAIDNMTGSENAAQIDLVAVYSSDGAMVASDRIPGGK